MSKQLSQLIETISGLSVHGAAPEQVFISDITIDSRKATSGSLFAAIQGTQVDGHAFIHTAVEQGVTAILCSELPTEINPHCCYILSADVRQKLGELCKHFHGDVIDQLTIVGTTGTNGKTSVTPYCLTTSHNKGIPADWFLRLNIELGIRYYQALIPPPISLDCMHYWPKWQMQDAHTASWK